VQVALLCGADLLASFNIPGVWAEQDVCTSPDILLSSLGDHNSLFSLSFFVNPSMWTWRVTLLRFLDGSNLCIASDCVLRTHRD